MVAPAMTAKIGAAQPKEFWFISLRTKMATTTAPSASMPSTERSTLPNRMTKVAPKASTSGIAAELAIRTKLKKSKKRGLNNPIRSDRTSSARSGAKDLTRSSHLRERVSGFVALARADSVSAIALVEDLFTSQDVSVSLSGSDDML